MKFIVLILSIVVFSGCGAQKAIDATKKVPEKMDDLNRKIDKTNVQIEKTNQSLLQTQESIRLQKLGIAKQNLEDVANAKVLIPVPVGLMGYAKLFAETGTVDELMGQIYLYLKEVNNGIIFPAVDDTGKVVPPTLQQMNELNQYKMHRLVAAQAISAFIPKERLQEIVDTEIVGEGRYRNTALNMLMLRFQFYRDIMLSNSLLVEPTTSVGMVEKGIEYFENLEQILTYPFVAEIGVSTIGFLPAGPLKNTSESLATPNFEGVRILLAKIKSRAEGLSSNTLKMLSADPSVNAQLHEQEQARLNLSLAILIQKTAYWESK